MLELCEQVLIYSVSIHQAVLLGMQTEHLVSKHTLVKWNGTFYFLIL